MCRATRGGGDGKTILLERGDVQLTAALLLARVMGKGGPCDPGRRLLHERAHQEVTGQL